VRDKEWFATVSSCSSVERTGVLQEGGNAGHAESVIANPGLEADRGRAALAHFGSSLAIAGYWASGF
jgi:hypothetical protein